MHRLNRYFYISIALLAMATITCAEYVTINSSDGSFTLESGSLEGLLANQENQFALSDQEILAATLNNDGIETVGKLSFVLASTDAGLSFMGLFDGIPSTNPAGSTTDHFLGISSTTSMDTTWFATGDEGSEYSWYDLGNETQLVNALLGWDHEQTSAGFAWGDVETAQSGTVNLYDVDLSEFAGDAIQFVTYQDDHWAVAGTADFSVLGQYAFSYQFVPAPSALALLMLAGLTSRRRRRL